ncbi:hypothetical protein ML401_34845 (plasmid) [Bradyrhizobium sp. 62B]|uniref:hypothetical protein n=1 Tax=Bradyrhizobium sp. 62B TaxID=2898442 RepID=UPI00255835CA|nr:hypothetical protein ML401_34845 [Bradyrhizobium sp. 62B]
MRSSSPYDGSLYTKSGGRKYLTPPEHARFIERAATWPRPEVGTFCLLPANAGCRISEALSVIASSVGRETGYVAVRLLKKRKKTVVREIPLGWEHGQFDDATINEPIEIGLDDSRVVHPATNGAAGVAPSLLPRKCR